MIARASRTQQGFTLLELLVAIVLLALISVILLNGVRFGTQVWQSAEARVDRVEAQTARADFLRRQLSRIYPVRQDTREGRRMLFTGTRETLRFIGPAPAEAAVAGTYTYDLRISSDGRKDLVLSWSVIGSGAYADRIVLMHGVRSVELAYFGSVRNDRAAGWRNKWDNVAYLPRLIRMRAIAEGQPAADAIDIVVAPRLWNALESGV
jgi:general secretion pathway protein J